MNSVGMEMRGEVSWSGLGEDLCAILWWCPVHSIVYGVKCIDLSLGQS